MVDDWIPDLSEVDAVADRLPFTEEADRQQWLNARTAGLGGSDAGTVLGLNKYSSRFKLWLEKTGQVEAPDLSDSEVIYWGKTLETVIVSEFSRRARVPVWRPDCMFRSRQRPWQLASVDAITLAPDTGELALFEAKTAGFFMREEWDGEALPPSYEAQIYHYAAVTGINRAFVACLVAGQRFVWKEVPIDRDVVAEVCEAERKFWVEHVEANMPPEVDGSDDCTATLQALWTDLEETVELDEDAVELARGYWAAHGEAKAAEQRKAEYGNMIRLALADHEVGVFDGVQVASNKKVPSGRTDWKAVAADAALALGVGLDDLAARHQPTGTTRRLNVSKKILNAF